MMYIGRISAQSIFRHSVPVDLSSSHWVTAPSAGVGAVSFYGINGSAIAFFHQSHVVRAAITAPVEEDHITGTRFVASGLPLMMGLEPADAVSNSSELRYCTALNISALICTPGNEAGAPFHTAVETVPAPEFLSSSVADLLGSNADDLAVADAVVVIAVRIVTENVGRVLLVAIGLPAVLFCLHVREI